MNPNILRRLPESVSRSRETSRNRGSLLSRASLAATLAFSMLLPGCAGNGDPARPVITAEDHGMKLVVGCSEPGKKDYTQSRENFIEAIIDVSQIQLNNPTREEQLWLAIFDNQNSRLAYFTVGAVGGDYRVVIPGAMGAIRPIQRNDGQVDPEHTIVLRKGVIYTVSASLAPYSVDTPVTARPQAAVSFEVPSSAVCS